MESGWGIETELRYSSIHSCVFPYTPQSALTLTTVVIHAYYNPSPPVPFLSGSDVAGEDGGRQCKHGEHGERGEGEKGREGGERSERSERKGRQVYDHVIM